MAGILQMPPGPFTIRQLLTMTRSRRRDAWDHTAHLAALIININRKKGATPVRPQDLNPYAEKKMEKPVAYISAGRLARLITGRKEPRQVKQDPVPNPGPDPRSAEAGGRFGMVSDNVRDA